MRRFLETCCFCSALMVAGPAWAESEFWEEMITPGITDYRRHVTLGEEQLGAGDLEPALATFEQARALLERLPVAHAWIGYTLSRMTRHEEAVRSWERAIELDSAILDDEELAYQCSQSLAQVGSYARAAEILGQMLARGVSPARRRVVLLAMGDMLMASECDGVEEAIELYQEAVRDYQNDPGAHWRLAVALYRAGRADEGEAEMAVALRMDAQWQTISGAMMDFFPSQDVHFYRALGWEHLGNGSQARSEWRSFLQGSGDGGCWTALARERLDALQRPAAGGRR